MADDIVVQLERWLQRTTLREDIISVATVDVARDTIMRLRSVVEQALAAMERHQGDLITAAARARGKALEQAAQLFDGDAPEAAAAVRALKDRVCQGDAA